MYTIVWAILLWAFVHYIHGPMDQLIEILLFLFCLILVWAIRRIIRYRKEHP